MVGQRLIRNAITLNSTLVNVGRAVGPIVAAALVATVGVGWCFVANAASFGAVIASSLTLNISQLHPVRARAARSRAAAPRPGLRPHGPGDPRPARHDGADRHLHLRVRGEPAAVRRAGRCTAAPTTYSPLFAAFGFGSVVGGLYCTRHPQTGVPRMIRAALLYAAAMLATALTSQTYARGRVCSSSSASPASPS